MKREKGQNDRIRYNILTIITYAIGIVLILQLFNLQIIHGAEYRETSNSRLTRETPVRAARGNIKEKSRVIQSWDENSQTDFHSDFYRENIVSATFLDNNNVPNNATESWNVSEDKENGEVMAWVVPNISESSKYDLYIGTKAGVIANEDSGNLFFDFSNLTEINFNNNFDTSNAINMLAMFRLCTSLTTLDLSSFDTTKVTSMSMMFAGDSEKMNIRNIDLSSFNTSNVNNMMAMFYQCSQLNNLDLNSFDTRNVTNMAMMFMGCKSLSCLDLTTFYTSNVAQSTWMIGKNVTCPIYIGENWTLTEVETGYTGTFQRK